MSYVVLKFTKLNLKSCEAELKTLPRSSRYSPYTLLTRTGSEKN